MPKILELPDWVGQGSSWTTRSGKPFKLIATPRWVVVVQALSATALFIIVLTAGYDPSGPWFGTVAGIAGGLGSCTLWPALRQWRTTSAPSETTDDPRAPVSL